MTRLGIELSPDACRIVEIDPAPAWERRRGETRVRSFAVLPPSGPEFEAKLRSLRNRRAAVVVWNAASVHRRVMVGHGSYQSMRAEAIGALDAAGVETRGTWLDIVPATRPPNREAPRPVLAALASGSELTAAMQPLVAAGIRVRTVMTPAAALGSMARLRRASWTPDAVEVFVALEERATCIALVRSSVLIASRDLGWGYVDELGSGLELRGRDDVAARLVEAIGDFVAATGGASGDLRHVCVCGGHPELRSMTALLLEQLDVEIEPLDSLFGIDATRLPAPVEEFRDRSAELRLAWAAAADSPPTINLLRARNRAASKAMLVRAAAVAGVAAGVAGGCRVQRQWWGSTTPAANVSAGARQAAAPAAAAGRTPPVPIPPQVVVSEVPTAGSPAPVGVQASPLVVPPARSPVPSGTEPPAPTQEEARPPSAVAKAPVDPVEPTPIGRGPARVRASVAPPIEVALPFEAVLGSILYSADRKLAIIDGRIVGPGDEVRGARIIEITPGRVILRDERGRLRSLTKGS